jgi:zinc protease
LLPDPHLDMKSGLLKPVATGDSVALFGAAPHASATAQRGPNADAVRALTLDNGLRIIVWPDHAIPSVALYNFVRVGSRNEVPGLTGLAHFFEHMMFNGTSRRAPGEFDREMEGRGGRNNASTSSDLTVYTDWFPRDALELVFDLESDRLANLAFTPQVIESERSVVYSERRLRVEDNSEGLLYEQVQATAFVAHPYQIPTIGWPSDIKSWRIEDLQLFYRTYYAPNNCTLVLVGDVQPDRVFALAQKYFGALKRQPATPAVRAQEPEQLGERRLVLERRGQNPLLQFAYKAPAASDVRWPAINLLATILSEGDASRLHRQIVEQQKIAVGVSAYWHEGFDPGLFWITLTLPEGGDPRIAQACVDSELARLVRDGVSETELRRAKNLTVSGFWQGFSTIDGRASLLGQFEMLHGDYRALFEAPDRFERVLREDVQAVAREVLDVRRRTVGVLIPQTSGGPGAAVSAA